MTQEDKELLLKDLCARLPYGVICKSPTGYKFALHQMNPNELTPFGKGVVFDFGKTYYIGDIKPYLRPMSSMTEEEKLKFYGHTQDKLDYCEHYFEVISLQQDFLLENHFDFRGLIPKDLALSTDEFNPYKD